MTKHVVVTTAAPRSDERVEASVRSDGSSRPGEPDHAGEPDHPGEPRQRRKAAPRSLLALGFAAMIGWLDLVQASHGLAALGVFTLGLAGLGLACWLWGYDSRDGGDWRTTSRR